MNKISSGKVLSRIPGNKLTVENVSSLLVKRGFLSKEQYERIKKNRHRRQRNKKRDNSGCLAYTCISPAEFIAGYNFRISGKKNAILTEDIITGVIAEEFDLEYLKIDPLKLDMNVVTAYVSMPYALRHLVVPIKEENGIVTFAVADPFNCTPVETLKNARKININTVFSSKTDIQKTIQVFYGYRASVLAAEAEITPSSELGNLEQFVQLKKHGEIEANDHHIVNAVEQLLKYAFDQRASDIHIEPKRGKSIVRLRIDGILHTIYNMPKSVHPHVLARLKMISKMNIAEKRRPQDGRVKTNYNGKDIELRISTMPVAFGEKIVIRIFDPEVLLQDISALGFDKNGLGIYNGFIQKPNGIILVTGPTGSGKTTTLYSTLKHLSSPDVNIVTIEDPIEMVMEEFNQVGVQPAIDVTFANILKTILRQDPDIIMVGEIRDCETAEHAVQSALTGHLVLSTLHTNDASSSITRLIDLNIPPFLISSTLVGIVAQRLVRKICPHCVSKTRLEPEQIEYLRMKKKDYTVYYGKGCIHCRGTGYKGRVGIFEILEFTDSIKSCVHDGADLLRIYKTAIAEGMVSLRESAVRKMINGITTYEEIVAMAI